MDKKVMIDFLSLQTYALQGTSVKPEENVLDESGFLFVSKCIAALEERGLEEQGLYRVVGVASKVNNLLDRRKINLDKLNLDDRFEWESKTITSALKTYLRTLSEPVMTFQYYNSFIISASTYKKLFEHSNFEFQVIQKVCVNNWKGAIIGIIPTI